MRIFIAIELEPVIKEYLSALCDMVKQTGAKGNFTIPDNYHITVKFIGETPPSKLEIIHRIMNDCTKELTAFSLAVDGLGMFTRGNSGVLWAGLRGDMKSLYRLHSNIDMQLSKIGIPPDQRRYNPHITLGRQVFLPKPLSEVEKCASFKNHEIRVEKISLMESRRENGRLIYTPLYISRLVN